MAFKIGDKVVITKEYQGMNMVGAKAKVVSTRGVGRYGLDIDGWRGGHCCDVLGGGTRSGWWVSPECFEKASVFKGNK